MAILKNKMRSFFAFLHVWAILSLVVHGVVDRATPNEQLFFFVEYFVVIENLGEFSCNPLNPSDIIVTRGVPWVSIRPGGLSEIGSGAKADETRNVI